MRIGEVMGRVTLSRSHPALPHAAFRIVLPLTLEALRDGSDRRGEDLVVFDELGAGPGSRIGFSEGREAANPYNPGKVPIDASCACLLDEIHLG
jgi:ethanolamine utilization protein EutN